jgi:hypothetical protein
MLALDYLAFSPSPLFVPSDSKAPNAIVLLDP